MRTSKMIVFLLVVLGVYGLANFYILRRGWQALSGYPFPRTAFLVVFGLLILAYPLGRVLDGASRGVVSDVLIRSGSFYLALMLHLFFLLVVVDVFRLANAFLNFFPKSFAADPHKTGLIVFITVIGIGLGVVAGGYVNALHLRLRTIEIDIDKPAGAGFRTLNIAMASDIHLGTVTGSRRLERIVGRLNALEPDIVLLPGDIVDESVSLAEEEKMISCLRSIHAPLGVFSVPGNHEVYGGLEKNLEYLRRGGVRVLQDEAVLVDGAFVLAGRKDPTVLQSKERRMPIREILEKTGADLKLPIILLDHQPVRLMEAVDAGIDLQLSGHTHAGQLFPLNLINKKIWEKYWGYLRKEKTQYYISCGVGTWGPPVRTGSIPEIVLIKVSFH
jgi:predicted MPP superfamily phosphohydrolase